MAGDSTENYMWESILFQLHVRSLLCGIVLNEQSLIWIAVKRLKWEALWRIFDLKYWRIA